MFGDLPSFNTDKVTILAVKIYIRHHLFFLRRWVLVCLVCVVGFSVCVCLMWWGVGFLGFAVVCLGFLFVCGVGFFFLPDN